MESQSHVPPGYSSYSALQHQQQQQQQQIQQQHQLQHHQAQQHQAQQIQRQQQHQDQLRQQAALYDRSLAEPSFGIFSQWQSHDPLHLSTSASAWSLNSTATDLMDPSLIQQGLDLQQELQHHQHHQLQQQHQHQHQHLHQAQQQQHLQQQDQQQGHQLYSHLAAPSDLISESASPSNLDLKSSSAINALSSGLEPLTTTTQPELPQPVSVDIQTKQTVALEGSTSLNVGTDVSSNASTPTSNSSSLATVKSSKSATSQVSVLTRPGSRPNANSSIRNDIYFPPKGVVDGQFLVKDWDSLLRDTHSRKFRSFVSIGNYLVDIPTTKTTIPTYHARKSKNRLRQLGVFKDRNSPKPVYSNRRSTGSPNNQSSSSGSDSSEYTDDSESESDLEEVVETSPLPAVRPTEPFKGIGYDSIKATWLPRNRPADPAQVKLSLGNFWSVIKPIRDNWRDAQEKFKKADDSTKSSVILSRPVERQRSLMEAALEAAFTHGHPDVIRHLPKVKAFMSVFEHFLQDRATDLDFNCRLVKWILQILSSSLDIEALKSARLAKILPRYIKRGDAEIKSLASNIYQLGQGDLAISKSGSSTDNKSGNMDSKKSLSTDKTVASGSTKPSTDGPAVNSTKKTVFSSIQAVKSKAVPANKTSVATNIVLPRSNPVVSKAITSKPETRTAPITKPAVKPAFSFAETMANLMKPKEEEPKVVTKDVVISETEEEKVKRVRKEARRQLRVTWAPPRDLEQIRIFHRDPEEIGRNPNARRDLDVNNEGAMFKQKKAIDVEDEDDEIDDLLSEWSLPSEVDFSCIDPQERERNYWPYGGGHLQCYSVDRDEQQKREATILSVHYISPADIPPNPRDPPEESLSPPAPPTEFGPVSDLTISRLAGPTNNTGTHTPPLEAPGLAAIMSKLNGHIVAPSGPESGHAPASEVSSILSKLRASGFLPTEATSLPTQQIQPPATGPPAADFSSIMALLGQPKSGSSALGPTSTAAAPGGDTVSVLLDQLRRAAPTSTSTSTPPTGPAHQANQHSGHAPPLGPHSHGHLDYDHDEREWDRNRERERGGYDYDYDRQAYINGGGGGYHQGPPSGYPTGPRGGGGPPSSQFHDSEGRKRMREPVGPAGPDMYDYDEREPKRRWKSKFEEKASKITCRFWRESKCKKGESCPFKHGM